MSILKELNIILKPLGVDIETAILSKKANDEFIILTPLSDVFDLYSDNEAKVDIQAVRISVYSKNNYLALKNKVVETVLQNDFIITDRRFIEYEVDTKYFHYVIDVEKTFFLEG